MQVKLTPRLQAVVDKVPPNSRVADIGTDHAYIPVYLLMNRLGANVIATDSRPGPLQAAEETLQLFNLSQAAELRLGDGLSVLREEDNVDVIIVAGIGGETICSILAAGLNLLKNDILLVLQPMTCASSVRIWLADKGFSIVQEDIAQEEDRYYEVIVARWSGQTSLAREKYLTIGPDLAARRHPLFKPMLQKRLECKEAALAGAGISNTAAAKDKIGELEKEILLLRDVLTWL